MLTMKCSCGCNIIFPQPPFGTTAQVICPACMNLIFVTLDHPQEQES